MKTNTYDQPSPNKQERPVSYRKLWISLAAVLVLSFVTLGYFGTEIYRQAPPVPSRVLAADGTVLFSNTIEILTRIKRNGFSVGIVTTKYHHRIDAILNKYGICSLVDIIVGLDDVKKAKPDPEALLLAIDRLRVNIKDVLYTGDSLIDAETAKNAHVYFFAVTTGTTMESEFKRYPNIAIVGGLKELVNRHLIL
jgi:HAD superfamily hydrolase (TIGR01549 family)